MLLPFPLAEQPELLEEDEQVVFSLSLGTEADVNCFAHYTGLDPAASVAGVTEASLPVGAEGSPILARQIHDVDLFLADHQFVAAADWLYDVEQGGQVVTGMLKVRAADVGEGGLLCVHDEVGYSDTLDRIMERLVRTWSEPGESAARPIFREVFAIRVDGRTLGLESLSVRVDPEGDYVIETRNVDLTPVDAQTLTGEDTYEIDYAFADGVLINSIFVVSNAGELSHHLNLSRENETQWNVAGTFQSKQIDETFEHGVLTSELADREELREFLGTAKAGDELVQEMWLADASPASITELTVKYLERQGDLHRIRVKLGDFEMELEVDERASLVRGEAQAAGVQLTMERLYVDGVFPRVPRDD